MKTIGYISNDEMRSNTYQLFHRPFRVKMAYIDLMDTKEIQDYGYVSSGDPDDDICNGNERIDVYFTIPKLLEFFKEQVPFYLVNKSEEHIMYEMITTHLTQWRQYAQTTFLTKSIPMEDLVDLSEMAKLIYQNRDRSKDLGIDNDLHVLKQAFNDIPDLVSVDDLLKKDIEGAKVEERAPHLEEAAMLTSIFNSRGIR